VNPGSVAAGVIRWDASGYVVAFTTRVGGVSNAPYDSLNLTIGTGDDRVRVEENRRRACDAVGVPAATLAFNRQVHSSMVQRARAGVGGKPGDGLWSEEPGVSMLAMSADCLPIAVARIGGSKPALAVVHAGWRGLAKGVVEASVSALRDESSHGPALAAIIGPAIGPCCYDVGPEVSALFDADLTRDGRLDLWSAAERALRAAGVERVERVDLCTNCNPRLFFSHRRDGRARGVQGVLGAVA
jgi:polyphenol oxidase